MIDEKLLPKINGITKWIISGLSGILGSIIISIILFFIGKVAKWW